MAFHGNLQVAIREAKTLLESGMRLAFFAPTAGEVERLADVFSEYRCPTGSIWRGEQVPEYLRERDAIGMNAGIALIRGEVARGTVFPEARAGHLRRRRSVRISRDRGQAVGSSRRNRQFSRPISST